MSYSLTHSENELLVVCPYNPCVVNFFRRHNGKWNPAEKTWTVSNLLLDKVREVLSQYFDGMTRVKLTALDRVVEYGGPVEVAGVTLAKATGRDSGARWGKDVVVLSGSCDSGGSMKNWTTTISAGSEIVVELSRWVVENWDSFFSFAKEWSLEVLEKPVSDRVTALLAEQLLLVKQQAEIQSRLAQISIELSELEAIHAG